MNKVPGKWASENTGSGERTTLCARAATSAASVLCHVLASSFPTTGRFLLQHGGGRMARESHVYLVPAIDPKRRGLSSFSASKIPGRGSGSAGQWTKPLATSGP